MEKKKIETKKDEVRLVTSNSDEMFDMWISQKVKRVWQEEFFDGDTGEVVYVDRYDTLFERGTHIDADVLMSINYWMQEGSIKEIEISNQKRLGFENRSTYLMPWMVQAEIGDKKCKMLVYASGISNVIEIMNDYLELHYTKGYSIVMAKEMESCIILTDTFKKKDDDGAEEVAEKKFYQMEVKITYDDEVETTQDFIIHTCDTDRALMCISQYLKNWEQKKHDEHEEKGWTEWEIRNFKLCIEKVSPMPINVFVPREFSLAYNEQE